jgi:NADPH-dependent glutamate synthase beta subunit-like oxidoreductase
MRSKLPQRFWITPSKLHRLEKGQATELTSVELGALALFYGKALREIDPLAAEELERVRDLALAVVGPPNPEPAGSATRRVVTSATRSDRRAPGPSVRPAA